MIVEKEKNKINGKKVDGATSKGIHLLSICNARPALAEELSAKIESVGMRRQKAILETARLELELRISERVNEITPLKVKLARELKSLHDEYNFYLEQLHKRFKKREVYIENITTTVGRSVFAQILGGDNTYTGNVNYTALGTNNAAAVVGDATLGTESYRKALTSGTDLSNVTYLETFFTAAEVNGTFEEYGMFIDGAAGADTGQLFNRFTGSVTKSVTETLNVQSIVTWNDA